MTQMIKAYDFYFQSFFFESQKDADNPQVFRFFHSLSMQLPRQNIQFSHDSYRHIPYTK